MDKPDSAVFETLGQAFSTVATWFIDYRHNHVHAGLSLVNQGDASEGQLVHWVCVEHSDKILYTIARITPISMPPLDGRERWNWRVEFRQPGEIISLVFENYARACGRERYTRNEAIQAFEDHNQEFHPGATLSFTASAPGRTVVRRKADEGAWQVVCGVILDEAVIQGLKITKHPQRGIFEKAFGIDIIG
jgi:hypothetical protein